MTWDYVEVLNWSAIEQNISIIVPCLIVLKPLLAKLFPCLATPHRSTNPGDAPPTIGSDPTPFRRFDQGANQDLERPEQSSISHYKDRTEKDRHVDHSSI